MKIFLQDFFSADDDFEMSWMSIKMKCEVKSVHVQNTRRKIKEGLRELM